MSVIISCSSSSVCIRRSHPSHWLYIFFLLHAQLFIVFVKHHIDLIFPLFSFVSSLLALLFFFYDNFFAPVAPHPSPPSFFAAPLLSFDLHLHPVYCVTSPAKDERYRAPPPTPPGYQGLALGDLGLTDGVVGGPGGALPRPPHLRPPDYSVALQRSKLLQSPGAAGGLAEARRLAANHHLHQKEARTAGSTQGHSRPPSICLPTQELDDSEDGTSHRMEK